MKKFITLILTILLFLSCSTTRSLSSRGIGVNERDFYVIQNGWGMTTEIKTSFMAGLPCEGMTFEHIFMLYGPPDQKTRHIDKNTHGKSEIWTYYEISPTKEITTIAEFSFVKPGVIARVLQLNKEKL